MKHCKLPPYALKLLKYFYLCAYFTINVKYLVYIYILNIFKSVVLYFSIQLFAMPSGIVVFSSLKSYTFVMWFTS